jgi:hypothetical protein
MWFTTQRHNINKYLNQIKHETCIFFNHLRVFRQESCQENDHFFVANIEKPTFH